MHLSSHRRSFKTSSHHLHLSVSWDHRFASIVKRLLWLWRPIWEWQSLSHLEHVKGVVGLLARHAVFLWSLRQFSSKAYNRLQLLPVLCRHHEVTLEYPLQGASLGRWYGEPGLPMRQDPPLGVRHHTRRITLTICVLLVYWLICHALI